MPTVGLMAPDIRSSAKGPSLGHNGQRRPPGCLDLGVARLRSHADEVWAWLSRGTTQRHVVAVAVSKDDYPGVVGGLKFTLCESLQCNAEQEESEATEATVHKDVGSTHASEGE